MNRSAEKRSDELETKRLLLQAAMVTAATLALLVLLILARWLIGIKPEALIEPSWLILLALPFLLWLVASGRLVEITAGKFTAKLIGESSAEPVESLFRRSAVSVVQGTEVKSGPMNALEHAAARDPVFLVLRLGTDGYEDWAIETWIKRLLLVPCFQYVAFLDRDTDELEAYVPANALLAELERLREGPEANRIAEIVKRRTLPAVRRLRTDWLESSVTNGTALEYLETSGHTDVAVVDKEKRLVGVASRADIVARFVSALVTARRRLHTSH